MSARLDIALSEALAHTKLAYQFAPGSYTFDAMRAVMSAIAARVATDWIQEFTHWNEWGTGDVLADPVERSHPAPLPTECVSNQSGSAGNCPRIVPSNYLSSGRRQ